MFLFKVYVSVLKIMFYDITDFNCFFFLKQIFTFNRLTDFHNNLHLINLGFRIKNKLFVKTL
jgi:hypothetical protein